MEMTIICHILHVSISVDGGMDGRNNCEREVRQLSRQMKPNKSSKCIIIIHNIVKTDVEDEK